MSPSIRTLIVDDHPLFCRGLRQMISTDPHFEVVGEAHDGMSGLEEVRKSKPELMVLDINLPGMNGLEVARRLQADRSSVKVIILTMHREEEIFNKALNLDVKGYVLKENAVQEIVDCLKAVAAGNYYMTPSISGWLLRRTRRATALEHSDPGVKDLTTAERRVLQRVADNRTSREIAQEFCVSPRTIEAHRASVCSKLNLHGSHRLLQFAIEHRAEL